MSGAVPCVASNTAYLSPIFAPGANPSPPTSAAHRSLNISPYKFGRSKFSKLSGHRTATAEALSIMRCLWLISGYFLINLCDSFSLIVRNNPSVYFSILDFVPTVTFFLPSLCAYSYAKFVIRFVRYFEIDFIVIPESFLILSPLSFSMNLISFSVFTSPTGNSTPAYESSRFSLKMSISIFSGFKIRVGTPL